MIRKLLTLLLMLLLYTQAYSAYVYGRYTGDGNSTQAITGLGFQPVVVLVKGVGAQTAWIATATMTAGYAKLTTGTAAPQTGLISSIDANGFTVASSSNSNTSGVDYFFVAWDSNDADAGSFTPEPDTYSSSNTYAGGTKVTYSGSYYESTGWVNAGETPASHPAKWSSVTLENPTSNTNVVVGYRPVMIWSFGEGTQWYDVGPGQFALDGSNSDKSSHFNQGTSLDATEEIVNDFNALGFSMNTPYQPDGASHGVIKGVKYNYVTFSGNSGVEQGTYVGDAIHDRKVTLSNQPNFLLVKDFTGGQNAYWRTAEMGEDTSYKFVDGVDTNYIRSFQTDGFKVGVGGEVNQVGVTFEYIALTGGTPLPIELIGFDVEKNQSSTSVKWQTSMEVNSSHFEIQRSTGEGKFETIGYVSAAGNSLSILNYSFLDAAPYNGVNYYRLKCIDNDGTFKYSNVKAVNFGLELSGMKLFPNPSSGNINVSFDADFKGEFSLKVYDKAGKLVFDKYYSIEELGFVSKSIDLSMLAKEVYTVSLVSSSGYTINSKFIKK